MYATLLAEFWMCCTYTCSLGTVVCAAELRVLPRWAQCAKSPRGAILLRHPCGHQGLCKRRRASYTVRRHERAILTPWSARGDAQLAAPAAMCIWPVLGSRQRMSGRVPSPRHHAGAEVRHYCGERALR